MNKWNRTFNIKVQVEVDSDNFPESKLNGNIEDQLYDLTKQFCFDTLGAGMVDIEVKEN